MKLYYTFLLLCILLLFSSCKKQRAVRIYDINRYRTISQIIASKKIILGTTINPISFYYYRNTYAGFEYEIAKYIAKKLKIELEVIPVNDDSVLYNMLERGEIDFAANNYLSLNHSYPYNFSYTKPYFQSKLIAIVIHQDTLKNNAYQNLKNAQIVIPSSDMEHIPYQRMKEIYAADYNISIDDSSSSFELMKRLIKKDSCAIITWDYLFQLSNLDDMSKVQTYTFNTDCNMSFLTSFDNLTLLDTMNVLIDQMKQTKKYEDIKIRYFTNNQLLEVSEPRPNDKKAKSSFSRKGVISKYDELFKKYAKIHHFDWKLIAAITYKESNFNPDVESPYGASGLMQLMPETGRKFGADNLFDPEQSIKAGTAYLAYLRSFWQKKVNDSTQVMYFVIASYNSGQGHILDAQKLAQKYNANPNVWYDNVELYLTLLTEPKYYKDKDCKLGYCKPTETINFVKNVTTKHQSYLQNKR